MGNNQAKTAQQWIGDTPKEVKGYKYKQYVDAFGAVELFLQDNCEKDQAMQYSPLCIKYQDRLRLLLDTHPNFKKKMFKQIEAAKEDIVKAGKIKLTARQQIFNEYDDYYTVGQQQSGYAPVQYLPAPNNNNYDYALLLPLILIAIFLMTIIFCIISAMVGAVCYCVGIKTSKSNNGDNYKRNSYQHEEI